MTLPPRSFVAPAPSPVHLLKKPRVRQIAEWSRRDAGGAVVGMVAVGLSLTSPACLTMRYQHSSCASKRCRSSKQPHSPIGCATFRTDWTEVGRGIAAGQRPTKRAGCCAIGNDADRVAFDNVWLWIFAD